MPPEPTPVDPTTLGAMGYIDLRALDFARQQPPEMPASEVVARAAEQGLQLHPNDVHRLRERDRARAEKARLSQEHPMTTEETPDTEPTSAPKRRGRPPKGEETKADFIRSLPLETPPEEVIAQGRERHFEISESYISVIRSKMKEAPKPRQSRKPRDSDPPEAPAPAAPAAAPVAAPVAAPAAPARRDDPPIFTRDVATPVRDVEAEFAKLVLEIGLVRADQLLVQFKTRLTAFLHSEPASPPDAAS